MGRSTSDTGSPAWLAPFDAASAASAPGLTARLVLRQAVAGMPTGQRQEIRVMTASFPPGARTPLHSHRSPVTVFVLEGVFTLELEGRVPLLIEAGQAFVEPPDVEMTGFNRSLTLPLRVAIFCVSDPGTPFMDPVH
jgi:quercetin dioxygenase-like cupin family protein